MGQFSNRDSTETRIHAPSPLSRRRLDSLGQGWAGTLRHDWRCRSRRAAPQRGFASILSIGWEKSSLETKADGYCLNVR